MAPNENRPHASVMACPAHAATPFSEAMLTFTPFAGVPSGSRTIKLSVRYEITLPIGASRGRMV